MKETSSSRRRRAGLDAPVLVGLLLSACGEGRQDAHDSDRSTSIEEDAACAEPQVWCGDVCIDPIAPRADAIQERLFSRSCALSSSCHSGASAPEDLRLGSLDDVFATAVDKPSRQVPALSLIERGRPEDSYLIRKLRNMELATQSSSGAPSTAMPPPPNDALCEPKIESVETWIRMGAPR